MTQETENLIELRTVVRGEVALPGDDGFDERSTPWNIAVDQRPIAVVDAADAEDVAALVAFAARNGLPIIVQPGGHGATGAATGAIVLRTSHLTTLSVNAFDGIARVGAGISAGALQEAAAAAGFTALAGSSPIVNVVALALGGGLSWFGRKYGWVADSIRALEVVTPQGEHRRVTEESDADLFWALRGGGGHAAVVTLVELQLHEAAQFAGGRIMWSGEHTAAVVDAFASLTSDAPDELTIWLEILSFPGAPPFVALDVAYLGSNTELRELLRLDALPAPLRDGVRDMPLADIGTIADEPTDPSPGITQVELLRNLDSDVREALASASPAPAMIVQVRPLGGAFAAPSNTPLGALTESYLISLFSSPRDEDAAAAIQESHARLVAQLPVTGRKVPTFLQGGDSLENVYDGEALERLRRIVEQRDPQVLIRTEHAL